MKQWNDIAEEFKDGSIVLGNGASRAISEKFDYSNLYCEAKKNGFIGLETKIFEYFGTNNFEYILRMLWDSLHINHALRNENKLISEAYINVRNSLLKSVKEIHIPHSAVSKYFDSIYNFLMGFQNIVSLNYDLILYWATVYANKNTNLGLWFKDCFISEGYFLQNIDYFRKPYPKRVNSAKGFSLIFYPHGNLILMADIDGNERKIKRNHLKLLDKLGDEWDKNDSIPIFVSEGNTELKRRRILDSTYLRFVFYKVLPHLGEKIVFYGWSISDEDIHILEQIAKNPSINKIAVSVYQNNWSPENDEKIKEVFYHNQNIEWVFFDAQSEGAWIY